MVEFRLLRASDTGSFDFAPDLKGKGDTKLVYVLRNNDPDHDILVRFQHCTTEGDGREWPDAWRVEDLDEALGPDQTPSSSSPAYRDDRKQHCRGGRRPVPVSVSPEWSRPRVRQCLHEPNPEFPKLKRAARALFFASQVAAAAAVGAETSGGENVESAAPVDILWEEEKLYSNGNEELVIRDFFEDERGGFFVDVGCSHPKKNSNTFYLEDKLGWAGIGVDGLPDYAKGWKAQRPGSVFLNYLVSDTTGGTKKFFKVPVWGLSTAEEKFAKRLNVVDELEVPTTTLDALLEEQQVSAIDFLNIDVEGHYEEVLAGFDLERWKPRLVCIEEEGPFAVSWFRERGYEPIPRYRHRDPTNWYFASRRDAEAANRRQTAQGRKGLARKQARIAQEPPGSPITVYLTPQYVIDDEGALVVNEAWTKAVRELKASEAAN
ncbi:MAG: FkbM family methyltransferase [Candidatus Binatia bacterium]|nr:FkbM family methyltransferase [Candidatus Binatia bacterium]